MKRENKITNDKFKIIDYVRKKTNKIEDYEQYKKIVHYIYKSNNFSDEELLSRRGKVKDEGKFIFDIRSALLGASVGAFITLLLEAAQNISNNTSVKGNANLVFCIIEVIVICMIATGAVYFIIWETRRVFCRSSKQEMTEMCCKYEMDAINKIVKTRERENA